MKVKFVPQNIEVQATPDKSLLQIATENNIEIRSICKGVPSCAECRVRIVEGESNVLPPGKPELALIGTSYYIDSRRLSCQVRCFGDVTVDLTEQVQRSENQSKKVRGFRSSKPMESRAVQDTMILNEKIDASLQSLREESETQAAGGEAHASSESSTEQKPEQKKQRHENQNRNGGNRDQNRGGGNRDQNRGGGNRDQNRSGGGQQARGGGGGNNENRNQGQNKKQVNNQGQGKQNNNRQDRRPQNQGQNQGKKN